MNDKRSTTYKDLLKRHKDLDEPITLIGLSHVVYLLQYSAGYITQLYKHNHLFPKPIEVLQECGSVKLAWDLDELAQWRKDYPRLHPSKRKYNYIADVVYTNDYTHVMYVTTEMLQGPVPLQESPPFLDIIVLPDHHNHLESTLSLKRYKLTCRINVDLLNSCEPITTPVAQVMQLNLTNTPHLSVGHILIELNKAIKSYHSKWLSSTRRANESKLNESITIGAILTETALEERTTFRKNWRRTLNKYRKPINDGTPSLDKDFFKPTVEPLYPSKVTVNCEVSNILPHGYILNGYKIADDVLLITCIVSNYRLTTLTNFSISQSEIMEVVGGLFDLSSGITDRITSVIQDQINEWIMNPPPSATESLKKELKRTIKRLKRQCKDLG